MMKLVPPRRRLPGSFVMKPRWAKDVPENERPPPSHVSPTSVWVMKASCRLVYSAPLGSPVVPEVKMIATGPVRIVGERGRGARRAVVGEHAVERRRGRDRDDELRIGEVEHGVALACRQSVVDTGSDRADLGRAAIGEQVLRPGRQHQRDDVALADTPVREPDRDLVRDAVDVGVGHVPSGLGHVRSTLAEPASRFGESGGKRGTHERSVYIGPRRQIDGRRRIP